MNEETVRKKIWLLHIAERAKQELLALWHRNKRLVEAIIGFIRKHRRLGESLLLGAIVAFLLCQLPWIGDFLGLIALVTSGAVGLMRELRAQLVESLSVPE
jgi:hypothetical protein